MVDVPRGPGRCQGIKPAEYRRIAGAVSEDGLAFEGEVIPLAPENAPKLAEAVKALRPDPTAEAEPVDPAEQAFAKAEKAVKFAIAEFQRLQAMGLDDGGRSKLALVIESCRNQLDLIHMSNHM